MAAEGTEAERPFSFYSPLRPSFSEATLRNKRNGGDDSMHIPTIESNVMSSPSGTAPLIAPPPPFFPPIRFFVREASRSRECGTSLFKMTTALLCADDLGLCSTPFIPIPSRGSAGSVPTTHRSPFRPSFNPSPRLRHSSIPDTWS